MHHCHILRIPDGPFAGEVVEEPEYEGLAAWSCQIGQSDVATAIYLANLVDRLGMDTNESSWAVGLALECYERGIITREDTDGLELRFGQVEAIRAMLHKVARRQGFGDLLAEGAMRAAQRLGGDAIDCAVHTRKGGTPRGHDHRANWFEMFDTCVSNTGTMEAGWRLYPSDLAELGLPTQWDPFSWEEVATMVAMLKGAQPFEDSLGTCKFCTLTAVKTLAEMVSAATGWDFSAEEGLTVGVRAVNRLRLFNLRHGITAEKDAPSPRYGSTPIDGPAAGQSIAPHWDQMRRLYYELMGWDKETGVPLPETLRRLGL